MTDHLLDRLVVAVGTQYLVDAEIGRGGMAVVYRATDLRLHRRVAIKVLPPELAFNAEVRERFLREAQTAAQLTHPNIVPIYTVDEREGIVYFVMALVDGESLAERLHREGRMSVEETRRILAAVADALAYAHSKGVVHRDVKPDNIMLDRTTGRPMVTDFGIARAAAGDTRLTVTGVAIGTPAYMSPEQALGERELDGRSDIYSLAVIGYQMLAGETPFKASNTPAMLVKHVSETPRPLESLRPDAPRPLVRAITRALAKRPEERWPDAGAFRDALTSNAVAPHDEARPPRVAPPPPAAAVAGLSDLPDGGLAPGQLGLSPFPPPPMPVWGSKAEWREWRQRQREWEHGIKRHSRAIVRARGRDEYDASRPMEERLAGFRRRSVGALGTVGTLATVNAFTGLHHPWFIFPAAFIVIGIVGRGAKLWADGVPFARLFSRGEIQESAPSAAVSRAAPDPALELAPADVLAGSYGETVRRAAADRAAVRDILARLAPGERDMIPDVAPTVDALAQRVGSLALTLHRLDADVSGTSLAALDQRIAAVRAEAGTSPSSEQERRLALLDRQRTSIVELSERRVTLVGQLESAGLALQNLRLDLLKLRSSGLGNAISDVTNATQEARALSRDIGHAVDAVREVKRL
ncbi:MAG TPA: serine/threonine-protein kinase [Gemmatimonadaceae bacterium]